MSERSDSDSRKLLRRLREVLATKAKGQERLDRITGGLRIFLMGVFA